MNVSNVLEEYGGFMLEQWRPVIMALTVIGLLLVFVRKDTITDPLAAVFKLVGVGVLAAAIGFIWSFVSNSVLVVLGHASSASPPEDCRIVGAFAAVVAVVLFNKLFSFGDLICDLIYGEGTCADDVKIKALPSLKALHEQRKRGYARKTYAIARRYLWNEERAYPYWMFAAETAACHLRDLETARRLIRKLCRCRAFTNDQKSFAVGQLRDWSAKRRRMKSTAKTAQACAAEQSSMPAQM